MRGVDLFVMNEYTLEDVSPQALVYIKAELHLRVSSNFTDYLPTKPSKTCTWCCNVIRRLARGTCTQSYCFSTILLSDQYWLSWSYKCPIWPSRTSSTDARMLIWPLFVNIEAPPIHHVQHTQKFSEMSIQVHESSQSEPFSKRSNWIKRTYACPWHDSCLH